MNIMLIPPGLDAGLPKPIRDANAAAWAAAEAVEPSRLAAIEALRKAESTRYPHLDHLAGKEGAQAAARENEPEYRAAQEAARVRSEAEGIADLRRRELHIAIRDNLDEYREARRAAVEEAAADLTDVVDQAVELLAEFRTRKGLYDATVDWFYGPKYPAPLYKGGPPERQTVVVDKKADALRKRLGMFSRLPEVEFELNALVAALRVFMEREVASIEEPAPDEVAA